MAQSKYSNERPHEWLTLLCFVVSRQFCNQSTTPFDLLSSQKVVKLICMQHSQALTAVPMDILVAEVVSDTVTVWQLKGNLNSLIAS